MKRSALMAVANTRERLNPHNAIRSPARRWLAAAACCAGGALLTASAGAGPHPARPSRDAAASRAAFLQVYRVFTSPRCQNCHPGGDAPLQGDDSHVHQQNVKRGPSGRGVPAMRCNTCHQSENLPGEHLPPGNFKWGLPPPAQKMVFAGRSPAELCRQIQDPKQNGGRSLRAIYDHIAKDDLVGWAWQPGEARAVPPLSREETVAQLKIWMDGGAACPQ